MKTVAIIGIAGFVAGIVTINQARSPDVAGMGLTVTLTGLGIVALDGMVWLLGQLP